MKKKIIFLLLSFLLLSGCDSAAPAATPPMITVQYTAAAGPWLARLIGCAGRNVINSELRSADTLNLDHADMAIRYGETPGLTSPSYQIGTDEIIVIASRQNPVGKLSLQQVRGLFGGQIGNWKDVGGIDAPVQVWVFALGEDVQQIFEKVGMGGSPVTSNARLATGPDEMARAIAQDVNAVGILPKSWNAEGVSELFTVVKVPVLASTPSEPQGTLLQILNCLQK
jgi:PBP superfamily domain